MVEGDDIPGKTMVLFVSDISRCVAASETSITVRFINGVLPSLSSLFPIFSELSGSLGPSSYNCCLICTIGVGKMTDGVKSCC